MCYNYNEGRCTMESINSELVRTAMTDIVEREKDADMFRQTLVKICNIPMTRAMRESLQEKGIDIRNGTLHDAMSAALVLQALSGNIGAYTTIRDTMGYKPVEQVKNDVQIKIEMPESARRLGE